MIQEIQLRSSVAPGGCRRFLGVCEKRETLLPLFGSGAKSGRNESILTIAHWAFHFIQICSAALKLVSGCAREKQKNNNTYYKSRLNVCTVPCEFKSPHLLKFYILKSYIPLSSVILKILLKINLWCKSRGVKYMIWLNLQNDLVDYVLWMFILPLKSKIIKIKYHNEIVR